MNDFADLTDRLNEILEAYTEADTLVDLDSWAVEDLIEVIEILQQALYLLGVLGETREALNGMEVVEWYHEYESEGYDRE